MNNTGEIRENSLVVYLPKGHNGEIYKAELGVVKRVNAELGKAWVWYHAGGTAACTRLEDLIPVQNWMYFKDNIINSLDKEGVY